MAVSKEYVEGYAAALWDVLLEFGVQDGHCKHYDPLTIDGNIAHSYVFDLRDGGRHHPFESLEQLKSDLLKEAVQELGEHFATEKT